jgi:hypothetical protein
MWPCDQDKTCISRRVRTARRFETDATDASAADCEPPSDAADPDTGWRADAGASDGTSPTRRSRTDAGLDGWQLALDMKGPRSAGLATRRREPLVDARLTEAPPRP